MTIGLSAFAGAGAQFFDANGTPLVGGLLYTYAAGTTTPATTYTDNTGSTPNSNPIVFDAAGRISNEVWLTDGAAYKFILQTSTGVLIGSYDNIPVINDVTVANASLNAFIASLANSSDPTKGDALVAFRQSNSSGNLSGAVGRTVHQKLQETVSVKDFGAVGDDITDDASAFQTAFNTLIGLGGGTLYIPTGVYRIKSRIDITCSAQQNISVVGDGRYVSILDFSDSAILGLNFNSTTTTANQLPSFEVTNIGLITSSTNCGTALNFNFASSNSVESAVYVADVLISQNVDRAAPSGGFGFWTAGIAINNGRNSEIRNVHAQGEMDTGGGATSGFAILLDGESTAISITDCLIIEWSTGIYAIGTTEGVYVNNTEVVFCVYGALHAPTSTGEPKFSCVNSHFNTSNIGVGLNKSLVSCIDTTFFNAYDGFRTTEPYVGVRVEGATSLLNTVSNCSFTKSLLKTGSTIGIEAVAGFGLCISNNVFFGPGTGADRLTYGVVTQAASTMTKIDPNNTYVNVITNTALSGAQSFNLPLIQSGTATVANGAGGTTVTLPAAFNTLPVVTATHRGTNTTVNLAVDVLTASTFTIRHNIGAPILVDWIATGY